jgi:hypothetical protein
MPAYQSKPELRAVLRGLFEQTYSGRDNAVHLDALLSIAAVRLYGDGRRVRYAISDLVTIDELPIGECRDGYYLCVERADLMLGSRYLVRRLSRGGHRLHGLWRAFQRRAGGQQDLDFSASVEEAADFDRRFVQALVGVDALAEMGGDEEDEDDG